MRKIREIFDCLKIGQTDIFDFNKIFDRAKISNAMLQMMRFISIYIGLLNFYSFQFLRYFTIECRTINFHGKQLNKCKHESFWYAATFQFWTNIMFLQQFFMENEFYLNVSTLVNVVMNILLSLSFEVKGCIIFT